MRGHMIARTGEIALPPVVHLARGKRRPLVLSAAVVLLALGGLQSITTEKIDARAATAITPPSMAVDASVDFVDFGRRASHNGRYNAEVVSTRSTPAVGMPQSWTVSISRRNHRPVAHARLGVRTWMPETGERSAALATAHYVGGGRYVINDVSFSRPGWWNVALVIDGVAGTDSLAFNVRFR
jgi:YtkA-like